MGNSSFLAALQLLSSHRWLRAIRNSLVLLLPVIFVGAVALLLGACGLRGGEGEFGEIARELAERPDATAVGYVGQFLSGLACSARDEALERAACELTAGLPSPAAISRAQGLVQARLAAGQVF